MGEMGEGSLCFDDSRVAKRLVSGVPWVETRKSCWLRWREGVDEEERASSLTRPNAVVDGEGKRG